MLLDILSSSSSKSVFIFTLFKFSKLSSIAVRFFSITSLPLLVNIVSNDFFISLNAKSNGIKLLTLNIMTYETIEKNGS